MLRAFGFQSLFFGVWPWGLGFGRKSFLWFGDLGPYRVLGLGLSALVSGSGFLGLGLPGLRLWDGGLALLGFHVWALLNVCILSAQKNRKCIHFRRKCIHFRPKCMHFRPEVYTLLKKCIHFRPEVHTLLKKCIHFRPEVHTLFKSVCTSGQKCMHFRPEVYTLLKSAYTSGRKCIHFFSKVYALPAGSV